MASNMDKLAKELKKAMTASDERKPKPYDAQAEVLRVENGTAWVHIPGGVEETPVRLTIDAKKGDMVNIHVANGAAWITGNSTRPPTDDATAIIARNDASRAMTIGEMALNAANDAENDAQRAKVAADEAEASAQSAATAADSANRSANSALTQLSVVEDVVGVLAWISEHATYVASTDTEVVAGKMYFTRSGDIYTPVANPTGNPSTQGYYEIDSIDEAVSNYVSSHLALTNAGLWVVNDNNSYKILLASDGMKVYDASGNLVSTFGESIQFSSSRAQYIGGENAYIVFNPTTGVMTIGGAQLNLSGNITIDGQTRSLTDVISDMQSDIDTKSTILYAECPTAASTAAKIGTISPAVSNFTLTTGTLVAVNFSSTNSNSSATFNLNDTGAIAIRYKGAALTSTTRGYLAAGRLVILQYDGTYWEITGSTTDANTYDRTAYKASLTADEAIAAGRIAVMNASGKLILLSTTPFDTTGPILYVGTAYTASALTQTNNYTMWGTAFNLANTVSGFSGTAGKAVFIKGTMSGKMFTPDTGVLTTTIPSSADGKLYMLLGTMSTTTNAVLNAEHPIYAYGDNGFTVVQGEKAVVTVYPTAIDVSAGTATLAVTLRVNGTITAPSTYNWTRDASDTSIGTGSTLSVSNLDAVYNCTVTW